MTCVECVLACNAGTMCVSGWLCIQVVCVIRARLYVHTSERVSKHAGRTLTLEVNIFLVYPRATCLYACCLGVECACHRAGWGVKVACGWPRYAGHFSVSPGGSKGLGEAFMDCSAEEVVGHVVGSSDCGLSPPSLRTMPPSCSWLLWRVGTTVRTPSASSSACGPRSW